METIPARRKIYVVGGGSISHVRNHLALAAPAYGGTARRIAELAGIFWGGLDVDLRLTRMADPQSPVETVEDLEKLANEIVEDFNTKIVFWTPAVVDFRGSIEEGDGYTDPQTPSGKYSQRLSSKYGYTMNLGPNRKIVSKFRKDAVAGMSPRKDIFAIACKTTTGATPQEQYDAGLRLLKENSLNLVLANDTVTRNNMIITPEEASYCETTDRETVIRELMEMAYYRSQLTFTKSTVIDGNPVAWDDPQIPDSLRTVVNHCIEAGAYKPFLGVTAGHFACKIADNVFLTSRRKTNFNNLSTTGLVQIVTDGPDKVVAMGAKPSVGGQSQRIVFAEHPEKDCIVHFHCPPKRDVNPFLTVSQREYECGSHECGKNTSQGLTSMMNYPDIDCVMLDKHGPNIVFHHSIDPERVIDFIDTHFDLTAKTGGYVPQD